MGINKGLDVSKLDADAETHEQRRVREFYDRTQENLLGFYGEETVAQWFKTVAEEAAEEAPYGVYHHTVYVWQCPVEGYPETDGKFYARSSVAPAAYSDFYDTPEEAVANMLQQEAEYFWDGGHGVASLLDSPFRVLDYGTKREDAERLRAAGFAELPNSNGGDDDFIVVDVRSKTWIYAECGCGMYESKLRKLHKELPDLDLRRIERIANC